jgi:hypothetical protein
MKNWGTKMTHSSIKQRSKNFKFIQLPYMLTVRKHISSLTFHPLCKQPYKISKNKNKNWLLMIIKKIIKWHPRSWVKGTFPLRSSSLPSFLSEASWFGRWGQITQDKHPNIQPFMKIHLDKKITTGKIDSHEILLGKNWSLSLPLYDIFIFE